MKSSAEPFISVIIPNYNGEKTIGLCLEAAFASEYADFEVIVVDDCSADNSQTIIEQYPCRLIRFSEHGGASRARNTGARNAAGDLLFFIDSDCLLQTDTLAVAAASAQKHGTDVVIGGTYTWLPYDQTFFSTFQSIFIHYSETKNIENPDYLATHAMLISKELFEKNNGFNENFMPILEDVEFSHRLKERGIKLLMVPQIQVQHIFHFTMVKSLKNGIKKSKYWSVYSLKNKNLLTDSGTASLEFKFNVISCFINTLLVLSAVFTKNLLLLLPALLLLGVNLYFNRKLARAFFKIKGPVFAFPALLYYTFMYPFAVGIGTFSGILNRHHGLRS